MSKMRVLATLLSAAIGVTSAFAQFTGPAPLSWRWQQPASASPGGSPACDGDTIYVVCGQRMYALNRVDGNQKWRFPLASFLEANFKGTPALGNGFVVAAAENRTLYAVDAKTGQKAWSYIAPATIMGSPQIYKNMVLFMMADGIMAVSLDKGEPAYQTPIYLKEGMLNNSFSISGDDVLVFSALNTLYAINIASQRVDWKQMTAGVGLDASVVPAGDTIYFVSNNYLIGLNSGDGSARFSTQTDDNLILAPAVTEHYIMALTREGRAYLFNRQRKGERIKDERNQPVPPIDLKSSPLLRPTGLDGDRFAVATSAGTIELVNPTASPENAVVWNYPIRPIGGAQDVQAPTNTSAGGPPGFGGGGSPGGGGPPGGGFGGGFGGGQSGGGTGGGAGGGNINRGGPGAGVTRIVTIQAAGPPVLDKTTLLVLGRDGSCLAFDKDTGVDLTPPKVTMTYPNAGDMVASKPPLALVFKIEDEASGVNEGSLKITVDGKAVDFTFNREGLAIVRCGTSGKNHLTDGKKKIVITVTDWMGNETIANFTLTVDNDLPPVQPIQDPNQPGKGGKGGGGKGGGGGGNVGTGG